MRINTARVKSASQKLARAQLFANLAKRSEDVPGQEPTKESAEGRDLFQIEERSKEMIESKSKKERLVDNKNASKKEKKRTKGHKVKRS